MADPTAISVEDVLASMAAMEQPPLRNSPVPETRPAGAPPPSGGPDASSFLPLAAGSAAAYATSGLSLPIQAGAAALSSGGAQYLLDTLNGVVDDLPFRAVSEGIKNAGYEVAGAALVGAAGKVLAPMAGKVYTESLQQAAEMTALYRQRAMGIANAPRSFVKRTLGTQRSLPVTGGRNTGQWGYSGGLLDEYLGNRLAVARPDELTFAATNDLMYKIASKYTVNRDAMANAKNEVLRTLTEQTAYEMLDTVGAQMAPDELARMAAETIRGGPGRPGFLDIAKAPAVTFYNAIDDMAGGTQARRRMASSAGRGKIERVVETQDGAARINYSNIALNRDVRDIVGRYQNSTFTSGDAAVDGWVREFIKTAYPPVRKGQAMPVVTKDWMNAQADRSKLREVYRSAMMTNDNKGVRAEIQRVYNTFNRSMSNQMVDDLNSFMPDAALGDLLRQADTIYAGANQRYNSGAIARLLALTDNYQWKAASDMINRVIGPGHGGNTMKGDSVRRLRQSLTHPETGQADASWYRLREFYNADAIRRAQSTTDGHFDATALRNWLKSESHSGRLNEFYQGDGAESLIAIRAMADASEFKATRGASTREATLIPGFTPDGQPTVLAAVVQPQKMANGTIKNIIMRVPIISGPFAGRIFTSLLNRPTSAQWLTQGFRIPAGAKAGTAFVTKLQMEAAKESQIIASAYAYYEATKQKAARWAYEDSQPQPAPPAPTSPF